MITRADKDDYKLTTYGLYDDGKPANAANGRLHVEMDTGKEYRYDEENDTWYEQPAGGGGGGGLPPVTEADNGKVLGVEDGAWGPVEQSGGGLVVIPVTNRYESGVNYWVNDDYTFQDVYDLVESGMDVALLTSSYLLRLFARSKSNNIINLNFGAFIATSEKIIGYAAFGSSYNNPTLKLQQLVQATVASGPAAILTEDNGNLVASNMTTLPTADQRYYTEESVFMGEAKHWYSTVSYYTAPMSSTYNIVIKDEVTGDLYHLTSLTQPYTFTPYTP